MLSRWRQVAWIVLFSAAILFGILYGPHIWHRSMVLYWQGKCSEFTSSKGTLIYGEDKITGSTLLRPDAPYVVMKPIREAPYRIVREIPDCWTEFDHLVPSPILSEKVRFDCILFLHECVTLSGRKRLVVVGLVLKNENDSDPQLTTRMTVEAEVFKEGTMSAEAKLDGGGSYGQGYEGKEESFSGSTVRFFAGELDPSDSSRFNITWDRCGVTHSIKGVLEDDKGEPPFRAPRSPNAVNVKLEDLP